MARVPLPAEAIPLPDVKVSGRVYPERLRVEATPEMFGAQIGQSLQYAGHQLSQEVGDQIFNEAVRIQEDKNASDARQGIMAARNQMDQDNDEFFSKRQLDAHNALMPALQKNQDTYNKFANSFASPHARRMFETDMASYMRNDDVSMRRHASDEFNKYNLATIDAKIQSNMKDITRYKDNPEMVKKIYEDNIQNEKDKAKILGYPDDGPEAHNAMATTHSATKLMEILANNRTDPVRAASIMNTAMANGELIGKDFTEAQDRNHIAMLSTGAKQIADSRVIGQKWGEEEVPIDWARNAVFMEESTLHQQAGRRLLEMERAGQLDKKAWPHGAPLGYGQVMHEFLPDYLRRAGLDPKMTAEEFLDNADAQRKVFDANFGAMMKRYGSFNAAARAWFTGSPTPKHTKQDIYGTNDIKYVNKVDTYLGAWVRQLQSQRSLREQTDAGARDTEALVGKGQLDVQEAVKTAIISRYHQDEAIKRDDRVRTLDDVANTIFQSRVAGQPIVSYPDLIRANPPLEEGIQKLSGPQKDRLFSELVRLSRGLDYPMDQQAWHQYWSLYGMAKNPRNDDDVSNFLGTDMFTLQMPLQYRMRLQNMKTALEQGGAQSPNLKRAINSGVVSTILNDQSINMNKQNPDWNLFNGLFEDRLEDYTSSHGGKFPDDNWLKTTTRQLVQGIGQAHFWQTDQAWIHQSIPSDKYKEFSDAITKLGGNPTDEQVRRMYLGWLLDQQSKQRKTPTVAPPIEGVP